MTGQEGTVSIKARPEPISVQLSRTAVLVVDMQNDFGSKGGMFDRAGIDVSIIRRAIAEHLAQGLRCSFRFQPCVSL
jgi:nicotinamidase-related amidase